MFSGQRADRRWSLRAKLIAQLVAVVALVCLIIGLATELALRSFLIAQVDHQLAGASNRAAGGPPPAGPGGGNRLPGQGNSPPAQGDPLEPPPNPLDSPNQGPGTLAALVHPDGSVAFAERSTDQDVRENLGVEGQRQLAGVPVDGDRHDLDISGFGAYRLIAMPARGADKLIIGLPLSTVDDTLLLVGLILGGVSL